MFNSGDDDAFGFPMDGFGSFHESSSANLPSSNLSDSSSTNNNDKNYKSGEDLSKGFYCFLPFVDSKSIFFCSQTLCDHLNNAKDSHPKLLSFAAKILLTIAKDLFEQILKLRLFKINKYY